MLLNNNFKKQKLYFNLYLTKAFFFLGVHHVFLRFLFHIYIYVFNSFIYTELRVICFCISLTGGGADISYVSSVLSHSQSSFCTIKIEGMLSYSRTIIILFSLLLNMFSKSFGNIFYVNLFYQSFRRLSMEKMDVNIKVKHLLSNGHDQHDADHQ